MVAFGLELTVHDGECRMAASGEIDLGCADDVASAGLHTLGQSNVDTLKVDLAGVTFVDSTALGAFVQIRNAALELNKEFCLLNPDARIVRVLQLTGLDTVLMHEMEPLTMDGSAGH